MSEANVELIMRVHVAPDADLATWFRDDTVWAGLLEAVGSLFHPDFECAHRLLGAERTYSGLDGLRASWLDWMAPWETYRAEIEEVIDCGDQVLIFVEDFGRREGSTEEVKSNNAAVYTIRDGKIARIEYYADRAWALADLGLEADECQGVPTILLLCERVAVGAGDDELKRRVRD